MTKAFRLLVSGSSAGRALVLSEPLSLWGGLDPETGLVIDGHHPQHGERVSGTVLVMPYGRGSSSSSSTFLEAVRVGTNPVALLLAEEDDILVLAAIVARSLYGRKVPVALLSEQAYRAIRTGDDVRVEPGTLTVLRDGVPLLSVTV